MVTFPIVDKTHGRRPFAFEIENAYVLPGVIAGVLKSVVGITHVRDPQAFAGLSDIHLEFRYMNRDYVVWEPFGDNTRYWIGPRSQNGNPVTIEPIEVAFKRYRPPFHMQLLGDLMSVRLVRQLVGP